MTIILDPAVAEGTKPDAVLYLYNEPNVELAFRYGFEFIDNDDNKSGASHYVLATIIQLIKTGALIELTDLFIDQLPDLAAELDNA